MLENNIISTYYYRYIVILVITIMVFEVTIVSKSAKQTVFQKIIFSYKLS